MPDRFRLVGRNDGGLAGAAGRFAERTGAALARLLPSRKFATLEEAMHTAAAAREIDLSALSAGELRYSFRSLRLGASGDGGQHDLALGAAVVCEALARGLTEADGPRFRATDEQVAAGLLMYGGAVVEMNAGEGKTVAAAFPAALHALEGGAVHVITANDYLAARDADLLYPAFAALGLNVGAVLGPMTDLERADAYGRSIVYGTLREFGFDFLRDNLRLPPDPPVQGALFAAVVDEADQVLLDQARSPLIISGGPSGIMRGLERARRAMAELVAEQRAAIRALEERLRDPALPSESRDALLARLLCADHDSDTARAHFAGSEGAYARAAAIVADSDLSDPECELARGLYFLADARRGAVLLTELGRTFLERRTGSAFDTAHLQRRLDALESDASTPLADLRARAAKLHRRIARRHGQANQLTQLLRAYTLLKRGVHYLVDDGRIVLIDQETGRTLPDSRYRFGIHAALEAKEGLRVRDEPKTLAHISVRGFVGRYARLSGMTGTASGSERELMSRFGLDVQVVPPSNPERRSDLGPRLYVSRADKLAAVVDEAAFWHGVGRPVLIGAPTIDESEDISRRLGERGVPHGLLNAAGREDEGEIVRRAGRFGAVTVATNMAGRGADIVVEPRVNDRVLEAFARLAVRLLDEGQGSLVVRCASAEDAAALGAALSRAGTPWATQPNELDVTVGGGTGRVVALEFGLGLYVIGTELNESSRTDRQLMGRTGRQGAPGASRFILSREDRLLAFGGAGSGVAAEDAITEQGGRVRIEGARVERTLSEIQGRAERDGAAERAVALEFDRILDAQTLDYYAARREILKAGNFRARCPTLSRGGTPPQWWRDGCRNRSRVRLRAGLYACVRGAAARLWRRRGITWRGWGRWRSARPWATCCRGGWTRACNRSTTRRPAGCSNCCTCRRRMSSGASTWTSCQQLVVSVSLAALDLRGALVECVMRCSDAYEAFRRDADAEAVRRMLRFDAQTAFAGEEPPPTVPGDLELIVGGQSDARPLPPPSNSSTNSD